MPKPLFCPTCGASIRVAKRDLGWEIAPHKYGARGDRQTCAASLEIVPDDAPTLLNLHAAARPAEHDQQRQPVEPPEPNREAALPALAVHNKYGCGFCGGGNLTVDSFQQTICADCYRCYCPRCGAVCLKEQTLEKGGDDKLHHLVCGAKRRPDSSKPEHDPLPMPYKTRTRR